MVIRRCGVIVGSAAWALPLIIADCDYNLARCTSSSLQLFAQLFHKRRTVEGVHVCADGHTPSPRARRSAVGVSAVIATADLQRLVGSGCWTIIYLTDFAHSSRTSALEKNFLTSPLLLISPQMERFRNPRISLTYPSGGEPTKSVFKGPQLQLEASCWCEDTSHTWPPCG